MVSVDISLTPSLPGATLSLSSSLNKRVLGDYMRVCFFGRLRLRQKEGVTRISKSKRDRHTISPLSRGSSEEKNAQVFLILRNRLTGAPQFLSAQIRETLLVAR